MADTPHIDFGGELPPTVDEVAIRRMAFVSRLFDDLVRVPGTNFRVGLDPILGALPVAGDITAGALSLYIVFEAARLGVSYSTLVRMIANVSVDVAVGSIPLVGDLFDFGWKANRRNLELVLADLATTDAEAESDAVEIEIE